MEDLDMPEWTIVSTGLECVSGICGERCELWTAAVCLNQDTRVGSVPTSLASVTTLAEIQTW